jgi:hypothetical protein
MAKAHKSTGIRAGGSAGGSTSLAVLDEDEDLTAVEGRLLEAMAMTGAYKKNVTELCDAAQISRRSYYRLISQPAFAAKSRALLMRATEEDLGPTLGALVESSKIIGREGAADRKLLLEVVGVYQRSQKIKIEEAPKREVTNAEWIMHYATTGMPIERWYPHLRAVMKGWREGNRGNRPNNFDELDKLVRQNCEGWMKKDTGKPALPMTPASPLATGVSRNGNGQF